METQQWARLSLEGCGIFTFGVLLLSSLYPRRLVDGQRSSLGEDAELSRDACLPAAEGGGRREEGAEGRCGEGSQLSVRTGCSAGRALSRGCRAHIRSRGWGDWSALRASPWVRGKGMDKAYFRELQAGGVAVKPPAPKTPWDQPSLLDVDGTRVLYYDGRPSQVRQGQPGPARTPTRSCAPAGRKQGPDSGRSTRPRGCGAADGLWGE